MLELHYPTVTKTILERQYPGKPTLKVAFGNDNGAIFENSSKLRASLFVTSRWPRSSGQTNYQVHHPPMRGAFCTSLLSCVADQKDRGLKSRPLRNLGIRAAKHLSALLGMVRACARHLFGKSRVLMRFGNTVHFLLHDNTGRK